MTNPDVPHCYRHPDRETHIRCQRCSRPICPDCMREAAVGFQCPDCVKEGGRTTRQAVGAYGGRRASGIPLVTYVLVAVNVVVFLALRASPRLVDWFSQHALPYCQLPQGTFVFKSADGWRAYCQANGGDPVPGVLDGAWWQAVTQMFSHEAVWHVASNMIVLFLLGPLVEQALGRARFLAVYLVAGLGGGLLALLLSAENSSVLGASGAIWGLMGAALVLTSKANPAMRNSLLQMVGLNVVITIVGFSFISWQGHLGGFIGGSLAAAAVVFAPKGPRRSQFQWMGVAAITVLVLLGYVLEVATTG